ncbi:type I-E CRISPR-associated protein Cse2/CasB [Streptomyces triculaminicus]|uniref:type I-E CRISPR-associated protein Cse2/CasB n=1 Tax=Streptomyces triculaminicus TaxID=2816232 RepID=UPI0033CE9658
MSTTSQSPGARAEAERRPLSLVEEAALRTVARLQGGYRKDNPAAVAAVARLRREAGREPHASPTSWGLDDLEALTELRRKQAEESGDTARYLVPRARRAYEQREEREDRAVHLAVTLWALHQQSLRDEAMHVRGWSLGRAVRQLAQDKNETPATGDEPSNDDTRANGRPGAVENVSPTVRKRFVRLGTSSDIDTLGRRLREMVLLLRNARIPLDYGLLAHHLDRWQHEAYQADVRRAWGRDFHRVYGAIAPEGDESEPVSPAPTADFTAEDAGE